MRENAIKPGSVVKFSLAAGGSCRRDEAEKRRKTDMPETKEKAAEKTVQKAKARKRRIFIEVALLSFLVCMLVLVIKHIC